MKKDTPIWVVQPINSPKVFDALSPRKTFTAPETNSFMNSLEACPQCGSSEVFHSDTPATNVIEMSCVHCMHEWHGLDLFAIQEENLD